MRRWEELVCQSVNQSIIKSVSQSINQSVSQPVGQSASQLVGGEGKVTPHHTVYRLRKSANDSITISSLPLCKSPETAWFGYPVHRDAGDTDGVSM